MKGNANIHSIENLLKDEQGLSMGEMLTVNFVNLEYLLYIGFD
jgi:3-hydroxyacyl-CoA dehydrogenase